MENKKPTKGIAIIGAIILGVVAIIVLVMSIIKSTQVAPGAIRITLDAGGNVAYQWSYTIDDDSVVEYAGVETKELEPGTDGGDKEVTYSFRALKKGETDVVFEYADSTEEDGEIIDEKRYHIVVDDQLNIKVEGI